MDSFFYVKQNLFDIILDEHRFTVVSFLNSKYVNIAISLSRAQGHFQNYDKGNSLTEEELVLFPVNLVYLFARNW